MCAEFRIGHKIIRAKYPNLASKVRGLTVPDRPPVSRVFLSSKLRLQRLPRRLAKRRRDGRFEFRNMTFSSAFMHKTAGRLAF